MWRQTLLPLPGLGPLLWQQSCESCGGRHDQVSLRVCVCVVVISP